MKQRRGAAPAEEAAKSGKPDAAKDNPEVAAAGRAAGHRSGAGPDRPGGGRAEFAAAAPDLSDPQTACHATSAICLPPVRVTDNLSLRSARIRDLAEGRGDFALRAAAGLRPGDSHGRARSHAARHAYPRAGVRHERAVDSRRSVPSARATRDTRLWTASAFSARICRS